MNKILKNYVHRRCVTNLFSAKRRRGLATVVSTAIILAAVSIMGVMLVAWANTNLASNQMQLEASFNTQMNKLNEDLLVENIWFGTGPNIVNVTMNNVGSIGFNVTKIVIKNSTSVLNVIITDGGIAPSGDYSIQESYTWNSGDTVDFTIFTNRGNQFTAQEVT